MPRRRPLVLVATTLLLVTASCNSGSEGEGTTTATTTPPPPGTSTTGAEVTTTSTEASEVTADLVFTNANVITMDDTAPRAEAVAITDDVISAVGDRATVEALIGDETRVIDLDGATVIPGLVDAHSHFFGEGMTQGIGAAIQDAEILSNGITTTAEFHTTPEILEAVRGLDQAGELHDSSHHRRRPQRSRRRVGNIDSETEYGEWLELARHLERRVPPDNHRGKPFLGRMVGDRGLGRADRALTSAVRGRRASSGPR